MLFPLPGKLLSCSLRLCSNVIYSSLTPWAKVCVCVRVVWTKVWVTFKVQIFVLFKFPLSSQHKSGYTEWLNNSVTESMEHSSIISRFRHASLLISCTVTVSIIKEHTLNTSRIPDTGWRELHKAPHIMTSVLLVLFLAILLPCSLCLGNKLFVVLFLEWTSTSILVLLVPSSDIDLSPSWHTIRCALATLHLTSTCSFVMTQSRRRL